MALLGLVPLAVPGASSSDVVAVAGRPNMFTPCPGGPARFPFETGPGEE